MARNKKADAIDLLKPDFKHVGRHRARRTAKDRWLEFFALALASVLLSGGGYLGLQSAMSSIATPTPTKNIVNGVDLNTPITVIDGTGTRKYAMRIGQLLQDAKFVVPYSRTLEIDLPKTLITIQKEEFRPIAKRIQKVIGKLPIVVKADAKYPIEVRLGLGFTVDG
jgi:hypothetical protein